MSLKTQRRIIPYCFLLPGVALFIIFQLYPLLKGLQMSFFHWQIMPGKVSQFIGFDNYTRAFNDPIFLLAAKNTAIYALITVPGQMILAMLAALLLNAIPKGKGIFRTIYYIPVITSWVIVSLIIRYLFQSPDGVINYLLLDLFHVIKEPIFWLSDIRYAFIPIWVLGIWKGIGWSMVIYLAALQSIPKELEEVAAIDGATAWDRFWHLTLPLISPTVVFTLVMLLIGSFNVFLSVYLITGGGPAQ
ncbi:MAG: sugar ABC transporter permease, partial [Anaerolineaceae bacterium]|nr:sugar ABC transporter permease [Anaerolineaceae bacterium]